MTAPPLALHTARQPQGFLTGAFWLALLTLLLTAGGHAQTVKVVEWNYTSATSPWNASTTSPAVVTNPVTLQANGGITQTRVATSPTYDAAGTAWAGTEDTGFTGARTSLTPRTAKSISTNFTLSAQANGDWSNLTLSFAFQRSGTAPTKARGVITWQAGSTFKRRYTPSISLAGSTWSTASAKFQTGDSFPASLANLPCLLEVYFWGTASTPNNINIDDLKVLCNSLDNVYALYPATLQSWAQNRPYSLQFSIPGYSGPATWSVTGTLPAGLSLDTSTGEISGTPTALGSTTFTINATNTGLSASSSYTLTINSPPASLPAGSSITKLTFDADSAPDVISVPPSADVAACFSELSYGFDASTGMAGSLHAGGTSVSSGSPINPGKTGKMRSFSGWDASYLYSLSRNSLTHYNDSTSSVNARFNVYPSTNTANIPLSSQTGVGENAVWQTRIKLDPNATGDLLAFYFDALRWKKDAMDESGINGPRWAELHAYWTNDAGVLQRWDSPAIDMQAVYLPEHRAVNQFGRYIVDLNAGATSLNQRIKSTTSKYRSRTVFFDLYVWYDTGADLSGMAGPNPPVVLIDELGVAGNLTSASPLVGIGNTVFNDTNYNGRFDPGEGIAGVRVELLNTAGTVLQSTTSTSGGNYLFSGLAEGTYKIRIPASEFASGKPLYQMVSVSGAGGDDGIDDDAGENGIDDVTPAVNGISSSTITLAMDTEPTSSETGNNTAADNADDDNTDLTVDFGFIANPLFCVGNRVFKDSNGNGIYDPGEGVDGVTVQLLNASGTQLASQTTANGGRYFFASQPNTQSYFVRVAASNFATSAPLDGWFSVAGNGSDNGADDDDNGVDDPAAATNGIKSTLITPDTNQGGTFSYAWPPSAGATSSNEGGTWYQVSARNNYVTRQMDVSVTLDTATQNTQALWMVIDNGITPASADSNYAALYLANGIVTVTPYTASPTTTHTLGTVITTTPYTVTNVGTKRTFKFSLNTAAVNQWAAAPATWLGTGFPYDAQGGYPDVLNKKIGLWIRSFADGAATLSGATWTVTWGGVSDPNIGTYDDVSPLTETGCDTTVDFGFQLASDFGDFASFGSASSSASNTLRLGALVDAEPSASTNATASGDDATGVDDEDGVTMPASVSAGATVTIPVSVFNNTGSVAYLNAWIDFNNDGTLADTLVSSGGEKLMAEQSVSSSATAQTVNITFTVPAAASIGTGRGARFRLTSVSTPTPLGYQGTGEVEDYAVTIAAPTLSIGNLVWSDANNNGVKDSSELGVGGATIQLYRPGADNLVNTADDILVSSTTTSLTGAYQFAGLAAGKYFVKLTPPAGFPVSSGVPASTDNNVDNNNDGSQPGAYGTALYSPVIDLAVGAESITDGDTDPNSNMTLDFGLFTGFTLGNLVFYDANNNGVLDSGESGISGLTVELLDGTGASFSPAVTTTTNAVGNYGFQVYAPGTYRVRVTPNSTYPLASSVVSTDNGTDSTNDGTQPGGSGTASTSFAFTLTAGNEPGIAGTTNTENTIDFGFVAAPTLDYGDYPLFTAAAQTASTAIFIGTAPTDIDPVNPTTGAADADDNTGTADEDLSMPAFTVGTATNLVVPVTIPVLASISGSTARLNVFIDWNGDGDVADAGETQTVKTVATAGTTNNTFTITPPAGTTPGTKYLRIRLTEGSTAPAFGGVSALKGEVEDYTIIVFAAGTTLDHGDWNGVGAATTTTSSAVNANIRLGATVDAEASIVPNATATADGADEDGVTLPAAPWSVGESKNATFALTNTSGANAYLRCWIDYNNDGDLDDFGELVVTATVPNGTSGAVWTYAITPLAAGTNLGVRVRLSSDASVSPTSTAGTGEIEDYITTISPISANNCYTFTIDNANENWDFDNSELTPDAVSWTPLQNGEGFGTIRYMQMSYNPTSSELRGEIRIHAYKTANPWQGFWLALSEGPLPRANNRAIIYYDGSTPAAPKMTMYVYDTTQNDNSWSNPGKLLSTSVLSSELQPGPMVNEGGDYYSVRFSANLAAINNGSNFPSFNLPQDWSGARFGSEAGVWFHFFKFSSPPTYSAGGALTSFPVDQVTTEPTTSYKQYMGWFDTGAWPALLKAQIGTKTLDYGDHFFSSTSAAAQTASTAIRIGTTPTDAEDGDVSTAGANRDDASGADDEDLTMPIFTIGTATNFVIPVTVTPASLSGSTARINVFVDWNGDGDVLDTNETLTAQTVSASGNFTFSLTPPAGTTTGTKYLRIRITEGSTAPAFAGISALKGEVEDYAVTVLSPLDFGDWAGSGAATTTASSIASTNVRLGATVDTEASVTPNASATADGADEDGVTMPSSITPGLSVTIPVSVFNNNASGKYLQAWIDFNNDGTFNNTDVSSGGERIYNAVTTASASQQTISVTFTVPAAASVGTQRGVRFRISDNSATTPTNSGATGEIEDYVVTINSTITIGNLVWNDANQNGIKDAAESGIDGVTVKLYQNTTLKGTTTTAGGGLYSFTAAPGSGYHVEITTPPATYPYSSGPVSVADDGVDNDNNGDQTGVPGTAINSPNFAITANGEPGSGGATNAENTIDIGLRAVPNPTTLLEFTTESSTTPMNPAVKSSCITSTSQLLPAANANGLTTITRITGTTYMPPMRTGSGYLEVYGLPTTYNTGLEATRTGLTPVTKTLYSTITFAAGASGTIGDALADVCPGGGNGNVRFFLTWYDGTAYRTAWTNTGANYHASWTSLDLPFVNGTALPTGSALGGKTFLLEVAYWGTDHTWIDNIMLGGTCAAANTDFGDHIFGSLAASTASQTASADIRIGTNATDPEASDPSDANANKDDTTSTNDEDLTMPSFTVGSATNLVIPVTVTPASLSGSTARIGVWVDWNGDGDVLDPNETLTAQTVSASGNFTFSLTPPAGTAAGTKFLRLRITEGSTAPAFSGASTLKGEVEDYAINVTGTTAQCAIVAAYYDNTIYTYSAAGGLPDGGFATAGSGLSGPYGMKQGPDGSVYITSSATNSVKRFNMSTGLFMGDFVASNSGGLNYPQGLAWGPDGNLYVGSYTNVKKYNGTTGAYIGDFTSTGITATPNYYNTHQGIVFGPDGNLYVGDFTNGRILKFNGSTGAFVSVFTTLAANAAPKGISFGPDGNLYVVQSGLENVLKINGSTGASMGVFTSLGGKSPTGLTWNTTDGNLYVNALDGNVYKINGSTGALIGPFAIVSTGGAKDIIFTNQVCPPAGNCGVGNTVFVDVNGNGKADADEGPSAPVLVQIFPAGANPQTATPLETRMTGTWGQFRFTGLAPGNYFLHIPASQFQLNAPLYGFTSLSGNGSDNGTDDNDDGIDAASPATTGVSSINFNLAVNAEPVDTGTETGLEAWADQVDDNNTDMTIDMGFKSSACGSNVVWGVDQDNNKLFSFTWPRNPSDPNNLKDYGPLYYSTDGSMTQASATALPLGTIEAFAIDSTGVAYMSSYYAVGSYAGPVLLKLDLTTAALASTGTKNIVTIVGAMSAISPGMQGLAFNLTTGQLYGSHKGSPTKLYKLGTPGAPSATATLVGSMSGMSKTANGVEEIEFTPDGRLFAFDLGDDAVEGDETLFEISPTTGAIIGIADGAPGGGITNRPTKNLLKVEAIAWDTQRGVMTFNDDHNDMWGSFDSLSSDGNNNEGIADDPVLTDVEGYRFMPCLVPGAATDFGDFSGVASASSTIINSIHLGATVDGETSGTPNATATGDDISGSDDEDGVLFPSMVAGVTPSLYAGTNPVISVRVHNDTGANAYLNAWMDFNRNGVFDAGEQIITNYAVSNGRNATNANDDTASLSFQFSLPSTASVGVAGLRFRFTTASGAPPTGTFGTGEVEDYIVNVLAPCTNLLNHGNFESGVAAQPNPKKAGDANTTLTPIPGWTFAQLTGSGGGYTVDGFDNRPAMADGMHEAWIVGDGSTTVSTTATAHMYQDVNVSPGATYDLRYAAAMHDPTLNVGEVRIQYLNGGGNAISGYPMVSKRITYDAESTWPFTSFSPDILSLPAAPPNAAKLRVSIYNSRAVGTSWDASKVSDMCLTSVVPPYDFGDWNGSGALTTTTFSIVDPLLRLGATVDAETSVTPNAAATADGADEDGVTMPASITQTLSATIPVTVFNNTGATAYLNAWIDLNNDGTFNDTLVSAGGERLEAARAIASSASATTQNITFTVPATASVGTLRGVRFRLTDQATTTPTGVVGKGEVEDYVVTINVAPPTDDYSDYSSFALAQAKVIAGLRLGPTVEAEYFATTDSFATGDDLTGTDDEDGASWPPVVTAGVAANFDVRVTNTSGAPAYVNVWIDWDRNGDLSGASERIATDSLVATGTANALRSFSFTPPANLSNVQCGVRVTLTSAPVTTPAGSLGNGEVEDYLMQVCPGVGYAYGPGLNTGTLYQIDVATGAVQVAAMLPAGFETANGTAYAENLGTAGVVIIAAGLDTDQRIAVWDRATGAINIAGNLTTLGFPANGMINSGDYWNGYYWFVNEYTDDLWKATITGSSGSYTLTSAAKVSDMFNNDHGHDYGDFVITPGGIMYGMGTNWTTKVFEFYRVDLNQATPTATLLGNPTILHNGITLGLNGRLYGGLGTKSDNTEWYEVSLTNGSSTYLNPGFINGLTDMTMGACQPAPALSPPTGVDYGDYALFAPAGSTMSTNIRLGALVDSDPSLTLNMTATGDDTTGSDDEDGVTLPATIQAGTSQSVTVRVTNSSGTAAFLSGWIDLNGDGALSAGEKFIDNVAVATGTSNSALTYTLNVPVGSFIGNVGVRFRLVSTSAIAATGITGTGEVEDYVITVTCPTLTSAPSVLPAATVNTAYSATLTAAGGVAPYTWALTSGALPAGITLNSATGVISGTAPATTSSTAVTFQATDAMGCTVSTSGLTFVVAGLKIGNLIWHDANCNGVKDASESGIGGIVVSAYTKGPDNIAYTADDVLVKSATTAADGTYQITDLVPGSYYVRFSPPVATYPLATPTSVSLDNGVDNDSNGQQPGGGGTVIRSPLITLAAGTEPTTDDGDNNTDMTIDFGLRQGFLVGDLVWKDENNNGLHDPTEPGLGGVAVALMSPGADGVIGGGDDTSIMTTSTSATGAYSFRVPVTGKFFLRVTPLPDHEVPSGVVTTLDNGVQDDNNGSQPGGAGTPIYSNVFTLAQCTEPGTTGTTNDETSIDIGLVPSTLGIGSLVFEDLDGNGHYDPGEGLDGITVQLYTSAQTPGSDTPLQTVTTSNGGRYLFERLTRRGYVVHLPKAQFGSSGRLRAMFSVPGYQTDGSDDQLGEDSLDAGDPTNSGITTRVVNLDFNAQPTDASTELGFDRASDNTPAGKDDDYDLTIDIGLYRRVGMGNLVFMDTNGNGRADAGEGVDGVTVQLYHGTDSPGFDTPLLTTVTANGGKYLFSDLQPGLYMVHLPASNFTTGKPLAGKMSIAQGQFGDDDVGEDGLNDSYPPTEGVSCNPVFLMASTCPTQQNGETGTDSGSDDNIDAAVDLTIDFGFQNPVSVGNLVFFDANANGHYDSGEGVDGVTVELYRSGSTPGFSIPVGSVVTSGGGHYLFDQLSGGSYFVHIPGYNFESSGALFERISMSGTATDDTDDDVGEDGQDAAVPFVSGISSRTFTLAAGSMPKGSNTETGFQNTDDDANAGDANGNMTIDFGFVPPDPNRVGVGNLVFNDLNGNHRYDEGEGVDGVSLNLYNATTDNLVSSTTTSDGGCYFFGNLPEGTYYIRIPWINWLSFFNIGKLSGMVPMPGQGGDDGKDDDVDENGDDPTSPLTTGVRSNNFTLTAGSEPTDDYSELGKATYMDYGIDENVDLTIDFGFYKPVGVGNLVFVDTNGNGHADNGEGIPGVTVKLFKAGDDPLTATPVATRVTESGSNSTGRFQFLELQPGYYFLHIPPSMFQTGAPLQGKISMVGVEASPGDDSLGEDGIDPGDITTQGVSTGLFLLSPGTLPATTAENGLYGSDDNGNNDSSVDLTHDFGFTSNVCVGNLVFRDNDRDGKFNSTIDQGVNNVTVELWQQLAGGGSSLTATTTTANGGKYAFCVPAGSYQVKIPASMFQQGGPLANTQASTAYTGTAMQDDNLSQDASDGGNALLNGAYTGNFVLTAGAMPTDANTETGFDKTSDNAIDSNSNLTIDLGFKPLPLTVGNLVFKDNNSNGRFDAGDAGVANVSVKLFTYGTNPLTGTPVASTTTATNGTYTLQTYAEGQYIVHIATTNFKAASGTTAAGPLAGLLSSSGAGIGSGDDNVDENGVDSTTPLTSGISSNVVSLVYQVMPTDGGTETGSFASTDNTSDSNGDLTVDFGFVTPPAAPNALHVVGTIAAGSDASTAETGPASFKQWLSSFGAATDPDGDADHDGASNLMEYALGTDPLNGVGSVARFRIEAGQSIDALLTRTAVQRNDLRYSVEASSDLKDWKKVSAPGTSTYQGADEIRRFARVDEDAAITPASTGYVRLRVELDADLDGTAESTAFSPVVTWSKQQFPVGQTTFSMPLSQPAIYGGTAGAVGASAIAISSADGLKQSLNDRSEYVLEVMDGPYAGHRFDLDEAATTDTAIAIDLASSRNTTATLPADLSGARISVRPQWTLNALAPPASFHASTSTTTADRVLFYQNGAYRICWLYAAKEGARWVTGIAKDDAGRSVIAAGDGLLLQPRSSPAMLALAGELRSSPLRFPASQSALIGSGLTMPHDAPLGSIGDGLRVWNGDASPGESGFATYTLTPDGWTSDAGTAAPSLLMQPFRAVFYLRPSAP